MRLGRGLLINEFPRQIAQTCEQSSDNVRTIVIAMISQINLCTPLSSYPQIDNYFKLPLYRVWHTTYLSIASFTRTTILNGSAQ